MNLKIASRSLVFLLSCAASLPLWAADAGAGAQAKPETTWVYPVIPKFGGVHPRPDAAVQVDPHADYKVFVDVVTVHGEPPEPSLDRLARLVNLMGYSKVPAEHVHIVALLDRGAIVAAMNDETFRKKFKVDNPSLAILHALKEAGVQLMVCSQAIAGMGLQDSDFSPDVTVTLSGLTDPVVYGQRGYSFMEL